MAREDVLLVCLLVVVAAPAVGADGEARVATVVGNGAYSASPLRNPPNDAALIAASLRRCGFRVTELHDRDQRQLEGAIRELGEQLLASGGVGLFYYAGHAMEVAGRNYLIPIGAGILHEDEVKYKAVDAGMVLDKMATARNRLNIVILDACRDNPFARSFRSASRGLQRMDAPVGTLLAYATAPGAVAADGPDANGLYTDMLLRHMETPGLPIEQMFRLVRQDVLKASGSQQIPWEASSLVGEFCFVPGPGSSAPSSAAGAQAVPDLSPVQPDPMVPVRESNFHMDTHEVTNEALAAFLNQQGNRVDGGVPWVAVDSPEALIERHGDRFQARPGYERHPVVMVSWSGAQAYCESVGKQLPSEAQWQLACQGPSLRTYPWGDSEPGRTLANSASQEDGFARTAPVGSYPEGLSDCGALDLAGNVWEWTASHDGDRAVAKGGSWAGNELLLRCSSRVKYAPSTHSALVGFRCVKPD